VLRARLEATRALSTFLQSLQSSPEGKRVYAAPHLAEHYGFFEDTPQHDALGQPQPSIKVGYRFAKEVVEFLRSRGAKIAALSTNATDYWATSPLTSEAELDTDAEQSDAGANRSGEEVTWVTSSTGERD
jgi:hypothetical protein